MVLKYDKITDDEEEANEQRLITIPPENEIDEEEERPAPSPKAPSIPLQKKSPEEEKFGSIIEKSR